MKLLDFIDVIGDKPVQTVKAGQLDLASDAGKVLATTVATRAQYESAAKNTRLKRKAQQIPRRGRDGGGGTRPFGYEYDRRTIRHDEAETIREAAKRILPGASPRGLCTDWNSAGKLPCPATAGGPGLRGRG